MTKDTGLPPEVELRPIPSAPGYYASRSGRIYRLAGGGLQEKKRRLGRAGYWELGGMKGSTRAVHRLVAETFLPPPSEEQTLVRHLDGDKRHNNAENLAWGTPKDNAEDERRLGRTLRGERNGHRKLSEDEVVSIRTAVSVGESYCEVAKLYGVTETLIGLIARGKVWKHAPGPITHRGLQKKITDAHVTIIRQAGRDGVPTRVLAERYGVTREHINGILRRQWRKDIVP